MELTLDQALQKGIEAHKAGKVQEADRYYTAILKAQPKHPDANHNMGVLAVNTGMVEAALPFFKAALEANPKIAQYWLSYIDALIKLDRIDDAKEVFDQAKSKGANGDDFDKLELRLNTSSVEVKNETKEDIQAPPNILDELKLDKALKLAKKKIKDGLSEEAKKIYQDILKKFPKNKKALDGIQTLESEALANTSGIEEPPGDQLQGLVNLYTKGQYEQALSQALQLLEQFPNSAKVYIIIGAANHSSGKLEEAIEAYKRALTIKPDISDAYNNMGITLQDQGKLEEAIKVYTKALSIKPDYAEAYNNMGNVLKEQGKLEETIESYGKALAIKPGYADAYINMAKVLTHVRFKTTNPSVEGSIVSILDRKTIVRPNDIAGAAVSLLRCQPALNDFFSADLSTRLDHSFDEMIVALSDSQLLLSLMSVCSLPDPNLEQILSSLRSHILSNISEITVSRILLKVQSALALHCFTNEYVYELKVSDAEALKDLEKLAASMLSNGDQPSPHIIFCLASFKALHRYDWSEQLQINPEIENVFKRQISEPKEEDNLKLQIAVLEEVTDKVSIKVRGQYEENPYPRWVNIGVSEKPATISEVTNQLKLKLQNTNIMEANNPDILIAGCGTGQHSIGTKCRFKGSKVLAIDLSLSSLAYAKRKTQELGIQNIDYMQSDILKLTSLDRQFDIIESVGVLHHMDDPMAGWRVLVDCLKPGGLMKVGLYSELARQSVVKFRSKTAQSNSFPTKNDIREFRAGIIKSKDAFSKQLKSWGDFYSMSEFRDLIFHVQEHRFTLKQTRDCLNQLGLEFCGFDSDWIIEAFTASNPKKGDLYDLEKWQVYEEANPRTFAGMYQFWCQKIE